MLHNCYDIRIIYLVFHNLLTDQYSTLEFNFVKKFFRLLAQGQLNSLLKADEKFASMLHYEFAQASENIGHNYLKHINFAIKNSLVKGYFSAVNEHQSVGNELAILSAYAFELGLDCQTFLLLWAKKSLVSIASTALKISRIKPSEIQQLLFSYDDKLPQYINSNEAEITNFNPLFEQVIYQHLHLEPKLFMT